LRHRLSSVPLDKMLTGSLGPLDMKKLRKNNGHYGLANSDSS
jgi:hypothetical protein